MNILITGANGFIGKNLICELENKGYNDLCFCGRETTCEELEAYAKNCDFVFHLAGVNRPEKEEDFMTGNCDFTRVLIEALKESGNNPPILCSSSTQAALDNPYGKSKLVGEELLLSYEEETGARVFVYRLTNVFGKWCKPNYNSAVATFCNNMANGLPIQVSDENRQMELVYIDDVVEAFIETMEKCMKQPEPQVGLTHSAQGTDGRLTVNISHLATLGEIVGLINGFKESRTNLQAPDMSDEFTKKLYSTYLSYLPEDRFSYLLRMNVDSRGSFTEILKSQSFGQISVNISKPGITKGNHWHHTKNEKFLVVSGTGVIRFRKISTDDNNAEKVIEYHVSGERLEVIDIPPGYTHNIENLGSGDMVTIMWANESFNQERPDTYFLEV